MSENLFTYNELESSKEVVVAESKKEAVVMDKKPKINKKANAKCSSSDLQEFMLNDSVKIRVLLIGDEPYFVAMDIAKALDYKDAEAMTRRLDSDEITNLQIVGLGTSSGGRGITLINESGLYNAILGSNKPESKTFKKWVTKEVLPSIRKTGSYSVAPKLPQTYAEALRELADKVEENERLLIENADQKEIINSYKIADRTKRNKQELATLLNRKIRELADKQYNKQYHKAYLAVYEDFAKLHCFTHKVDMQFLRTNIDYLSECLKLVLDLLDKE